MQLGLRNWKGSVAAGVSLAGNERGRPAFLVRARSEQIENPVHDPARSEDPEAEYRDHRRKEN
jgi:hypothetical protein